MMNFKLFPLAIATGISLCLMPTRALAQEVAWRHDYAAARKEATETGRPLLLDFGYDGCVWCRKLDATTFRDPTVAKALNQRVIPVKVDAQRDERVVRAMGIESYPTLVLASADGKILGKHVGYAEVGQVTALLAKMQAVSAPPSAVSTLLLQARSAHAEGRYVECVGLCRELSGGGAVQGEVAEARRLIERMAADPAAQKHLGEQIASGLDSLRPKLAQALER